MDIPHFQPVAEGLADVALVPGDIIGGGIPFHGRPLLVSTQGHHTPARRLEVVRLLEAGTHHLLYLVRDVTTADTPAVVEGAAPPPYGRGFAVKIFSKSQLAGAPLRQRDSILSETRIHQSLPAHKNILSFHRAYVNDVALVLLLGSIPGENRIAQFVSDPHFSSDPSSAASSPPPSRHSINTIVSVFSQMCEAVAACHEAGVYLRDLQAEDFIVTSSSALTSPAVHSDDGLLVKLKGFGQSICASSESGSGDSDSGVLDDGQARGEDVYSLGKILTTGRLSGRTASTDSADARVRFSAPGSDFTLLKQHMDVTVARAQVTGARELGRWARNTLQILVDLPPPYALLRQHIDATVARAQVTGARELISTTDPSNASARLPAIAEEEDGVGPASASRAASGRRLELEDAGFRLRAMRPARPPSPGHALPAAPPSAMRALVSRVFGRRPRRGAVPVARARDKVDPGTLDAPVTAFWNASAASSAVSVTTRSSYKSRKNVYMGPPGRAFLR
ncbi:hypothetical protein BV25DRAFT_1552881 [Artomyces pyxidatus]|uniref:Uncharacterized protein n=1 Tax=Artomyces pyxidatus TaxID=48021 RepID=A0ACB8SK99_9AGAM|nr:hypothetical protein BV25DRAFT_1552881 [Artomyces pyxidatus]